MAKDNKLRPSQPPRSSGGAPFKPELRQFLFKAIGPLDKSPQQYRFGLMKARLLLLGVFLSLFVSANQAQDASPTDGLEPAPPAASDSTSTLSLSEMFEDPDWVWYLAACVDLYLVQADTVLSEDAYESPYAFFGSPEVQAITPGEMWVWLDENFPMDAANLAVTFDHWRSRAAIPAIDPAANEQAIDPSADVNNQPSQIANLTAFTYNDLVNLVAPIDSWIRDGWSGGWGSYQGTATAKYGDTLSELARLITGRASDWPALGISQSIKEGQKVEIAPLLVVLEDRMRGNVGSATKSFKATFGLPVPPFQGSGSAEVNQFFGSGAIQCDCTAAAYIVLAKGLLDTIGAADFDALGYRSQTYPMTHEQPITTSKMKLGDWSYFENYGDYLQVAGGAWRGENVIKVGNDQYWGHGGGVRSQTSWYTFLRDAYNKESGQNRSDPIPGFTGFAHFVDMANVGMSTFDLRKKRKQGNP